MLAFCCFKLGNFAHCEEYLEEYEQAKQNTEITNEQIEDAIKEMKVELSKRKKQIEETGEDDEWMDVEDEDEDLEA